jgi:hypothetical protein
MCNPFNGLIDEVRIWNDVRTAQEITENYNAVVLNAEQDLAAYYRFNECRGTSIFDEKTAISYIPSFNSRVWSGTDAGVTNFYLRLLPRGHLQVEH